MTYLCPGLLWCLYELSMARRMGQERWHSTIVSGFFGWVGLLIGNLRRAELVGMGEKNPWGENIFKICTDSLVHLTKFMNFLLKVYAVV